MLKLITGAISAGGHARIKDTINALVKEKKRSYLIVPEQQPFPSPRDLPSPGTELGSPALQANS